MPTRPEKPSRRQSRRRLAHGHAEQQAAPKAPSFVKSKIEPYDLLREEELVRIEQKADEIMQEVGMDFRGDPEVLEIWRDAGADVSGERVRFEKGMLRSIIQKSAPAEFTQIARNPDFSIRVGGRNMVFAPCAGAAFVHDIDEGRRYGTMRDFDRFVKLSHMSPHLQLSGEFVCEPMDVPVLQRHLDATYSHFRLSDKPFLGAARGSECAEDCLEMARIVFGAETVKNNCCYIANVNVNSPLLFDDTMLQALKVYARAGQAVIVAPFVMGGATGPLPIAANVAQGLAETMAGAALIQLIRPGAPTVLGFLCMATDMRTGSIYRGPESSLAQLAFGQLARRVGIPFRGGSSAASSKVADAQAMRESADNMFAAVMSGVNFVLQSVGVFDTGLCASFEKFIMDADHLGVLHRILQGIDLSEDEFGIDAFKAVGPGEHYLSCDHTMARYKTNYYESVMNDTTTYEQWVIDGEQDAIHRANKIWKKMLANYEAPPLDAEIDEALQEFIAKRRAELPTTLQ